MNSEHDANAQMSYEFYRAEHSKDPRWKGKRDRELWNYWLVHDAKEEFRDAKYQGRNQTLGKGWKGAGDAKGLFKGTLETLGINQLKELLPGGKAQKFLSLLATDPKAAGQKYKEWRGSFLGSGQMILPWAPGRLPQIGSGKGQQLAFSLYSPGTGEKIPLAAMDSKLMKGWLRATKNAKAVAGRPAKEETGTLSIGKVSRKATSHKAALDEYLGWGSEDLNMFLREEAHLGQPMSRAMKKMYSGMMMSMRRLATPTTVYRGLPWDAFGPLMTPYRLKGLEGKIYRDPAFLSTSEHKGIATDFMGSAGYNDWQNRGALLTIHLPKGQKVARTPGWGKGGAEFVLPPNTALKINKVEIKGKQWVDSLEVGGGHDFRSLLEGVAAIDATAIPKLAQGGIVSRPTLAMIGERGPEAVVPLSHGGYGGDIFKIGTVHVHGVENVDGLMDELRKKTRSGSAQSRGRMKQHVALR
jgi:hypothetical protein